MTSCILAWARVLYDVRPSPPALRGLSEVALLASPAIIVSMLVGVLSWSPLPMDRAGMYVSVVIGIISLASAMLTLAVSVMPCDESGSGLVALSGEHPARLIAITGVGTVAIAAHVALPCRMRAWGMLVASADVVLVWATFVLDIWARSSASADVDASRLFAVQLLIASAGVVATTAGSSTAPVPARPARSAGLFTDVRVPGYMLGELP